MKAAPINASHPGFTPLSGFKCVYLGSGIHKLGEFLDLISQSTLICRARVGDALTLLNSFGLPCGPVASAGLQSCRKGRSHTLHDRNRTMKITWA